jgi:glucose-6-phosphate 1-dehydrogenase
VHSWRWDSIPFYIRAGKNLPTTCLEIVARLRKPPTTNLTEPDVPQNYIRFRLSPEITIATAVSAAPADGAGARRQVEMIASRHPRPEEMEAYERVLTDAMAGDASLFARQDYVEEAWRIVDPVLRDNTPVYSYEPGSWGPEKANEAVVPPGGWHEPVPDGQDDFRIVGTPEKA